MVAFQLHYFPFPSTAPLEEVDYTSRDQLEAAAASSNAAAAAAGASVSTDLHRHLLMTNLQAGAGGGDSQQSSSSQDSHNDSGYSTRMGFSAGPSPSLSGNKFLLCGIFPVLYWNYSRYLKT